MNLFFSVAKGPKLFIELARWADHDAPGGLFDFRRENGELLIWLGRVHLIYTPARWRPPARGPTIHGRKPPTDCRLAS